MVSSKPITEIVSDPLVISKEFKDQLLQELQKAKTSAPVDVVLPEDPFGDNGLFPLTYSPTADAPTPPSSPTAAEYPKTSPLNPFAKPFYPTLADGPCPPPPRAPFAPVAPPARPPPSAPITIPMPRATHLILSSPSSPSAPNLSTSSSGPSSYSPPCSVTPSTPSSPVLGEIDRVSGNVLLDMHCHSPLLHDDQFDDSFEPHCSPHVRACSPCHSSPVLTRCALPSPQCLPRWVSVTHSSRSLPSPPSSALTTRGLPPLCLSNQASVSRPLSAPCALPSVYNLPLYYMASQDLSIENKFVSDLMSDLSTDAPSLVHEQHIETPCVELRQDVTTENSNKGPSSSTSSLPFVDSTLPLNEHHILPSSSFPLVPADTPPSTSLKLSSVHTPPLSKHLFGKHKPNNSCTFDDLINIPSPYGIPSNILDELKQKTVYNYLTTPCFSTFDLLSSLSNTPSKKKHSLVDMVFLNNTRMHTYNYRITTRSGRQLPSLQPTPDSDTSDSPSPLPQQANSPTPPTSQQGQMNNPHPSPSLGPAINLYSPTPDTIPFEDIPPDPLPHHGTPLPPAHTPYPMCLPPSSPHEDASTTALFKLVQKPKTFSGTGPYFRRQNTKVWLDQMTCWLDCISAPASARVKLAFTFLQPPAFNVLTASKASMEISHEWTNTFQQFSDLLLKHYGDVDPDFTLRTRLARLTVHEPHQLLNYTKQFHDIATRITDQPLSDQAKVTSFLNGIKNQTLFKDLIIEPNTGLRWTQYDKLHNYVISKYALLNLHARPSPSTFNPTRPPLRPVTPYQPRRLFPPPPNNAFPRSTFVSRPNRPPFRRPFQGPRRPFTPSQPRFPSRSSNDQRRLPPTRPFTPNRPANLTALATRNRQYSRTPRLLRPTTRITKKPFSRPSIPSFRNHRSRIGNQ